MYVCAPPHGTCMQCTELQQLMGGGCEPGTATATATRGTRVWRKPTTHDVVHMHHVAQANHT
jgi:hypothetical protein